MTFNNFVPLTFPPVSSVQCFCVLFFCPTFGSMAKLPFLNYCHCHQPQLYFVLSVNLQMFARLHNYDGEHGKCYACLTH